MTTVALMMILAFMSSGAAEEEAKPEAAPKAKVICDKEFKMVRPIGGEDQDVGTYRIRGIERNDGRQIEIVEEMAMDYRGRTAGYTSTVIYKTAPALTPVKGGTETTLNGKPCMKGGVVFEGKTFSRSCVGLLNKRTMEKIAPPKKYEKRDVPRPEGVLVFQSALPVIGPKLIAKTGELKNIVFVEFPDDLDAPELINLKKGHRVVRDAPDAEGRYSIKIVRAGSDKPISEARFNKADKLLSLAQIGKFRLVEAEKK